MRDRFRRVHSVFHFTGNLLWILGAILLVPGVVALLNWGHKGDGWHTAISFVLSAFLAAFAGVVMRRAFKAEPPDTASAMLICAVGWVLASVFAAIPFMLGIGSTFVDGYFEAMSGFTTTGITVLSGLDEMPRSIIFWRALTQWLGGTGILSFFLMVTFRGGGAHHVFGAEGHKIASGRPAPGIYSTLKIVWGLYSGFTIACMVTYMLLGMTAFDAVCHAFSTLSTGGYSPYDASIAYYRLNGHPHFRAIEYAVAFFMMLGGINFLIHYRVVTGDIRSLWDNVEMRYWWAFVGGFTVLIMADSMSRAGFFQAVFANPKGIDFGEVERSFRLTVFQVIGIMTTTGFGTEDIGSGFFPALSKQLFLVMMVIGGCVGSTAGGIKVLRVAIVNKLLFREVFKLRVSGRTSTGLVVDRKIVPDDEAHRVAGLLFAWIALLAIGGGITALFSSLGPWESYSGMFSALGNIGPCYISVPDMIAMNWVVKATYIIGMLAGRLEILPVLLLFSRKAWK